MDEYRDQATWWEVQTRKDRLHPWELVDTFDTREEAEAYVDVLPDGSYRVMINHGLA